MYFRPPEGKCYSQTLKWSQDMGYATILWSMAHVDWYTDNQPKPEDAIALIYACDDVTHGGWGVLGFGASVDGKHSNIICTGGIYAQSIHRHTI